MTLIEAEETLKLLRLRLTPEDLSGDRSIWKPSNWTVVEQELAPGRGMEEGATVRVRVLKHEEARAEIAANPPNTVYDPHVDEKVFSGTVTGYAREGTIDVSTVLVDGTPVTMDLIQPLAPLCGSALKEGLEEAGAELERQLPVGTHVLVVRSERYSPDGFIHVLEPNVLVPDVAPPAGSVNESLVLTGWWIPDWTMEGGIGLTGYGDKSTAFLPYSPTFSVKGQALAYVPHIAQAGDSAVEQYIGTVGDCRRAAEADRETYVRAWAEKEKERNALIADLNRRIKAGEFNCRDGDGDGRCYER